MKQHSDELKSEIAIMWNTGSSATQIGRKFGFNRNQIIGIVNRMRAVNDPRIIRSGSPHARTWTDDDSLFLMACREPLHSKPWSFTEIAKLLGRDRTSVNDHYNAIIRDLAKSELA